VSSTVSIYAKDVLERYVLLRQVEKAAAARPRDFRALARVRKRAGRERLEAALGARGAVGLVLARAAVTLFLEAAVALRTGATPEDERTPVGLWSLYDDLVAKGDARPLPLSLVPAREACRDDASPDDQIALHGDGLVDLVLALATFLEDEADLRTPLHVRLERFVRIAVVLLGVALFVDLAAHVLAKPNVALHAPVVTSSRRPGAGGPEALTNGDVEHASVFATKDDADPWVRVDLPAVSRVASVTVFDGDDHQDDSLPLRIETSVDGAAWEAGGNWAAHFTPASPAKVTFAARDARFIRVHGHPGGALYLSEVEVR
jgi:F5/8 type C domain